MPIHLENKLNTNVQYWNKIIINCKYIWFWIFWINQDRIKYRGKGEGNTNIQRDKDFRITITVFLFNCIYTIESHCRSAPTNPIDWYLLRLRKYKQQTTILITIIVHECIMCVCVGVCVYVCVYIFITIYIIYLYNIYTSLCVLLATLFCRLITKRRILLRLRQYRKARRNSL